MGVEIIVPVSLFASIVIVVWLIRHFSFKKREAAHETIRHAISNGQPVSSDLIQDLSAITDPVRADLRRGVLLIALALPILVFGGMIAMENEESFMPVIGVASFPGILGLAYIGLWAFGNAASKR